MGLLYNLLSRINASTDGTQPNQCDGTSGTGSPCLHPSRSLHARPLPPCPPATPCSAPPATLATPRSPCANPQQPDCPWHNKCAQYRGTCHILESKQQNIARVRNCPDFTLSNSLFGLCLYVFLSFCLHITPIKCQKGLKSQKSLFVSKF